MSSRRWSVGVAVLGLVLGVVVAAVLVVRVHLFYGEWGLWPSDAPPKLSFDGREYRRAGPGSIEAGDVVVDHVGRRGEVFGPPNWPDAPTVLELRTPDGVTDYSLVGGP